MEFITRRYVGYKLDIDENFDYEGKINNIIDLADLDIEARLLFNQILKDND